MNVKFSSVESPIFSLAHILLLGKIKISPTALTAVGHMNTHLGIAGLSFNIRVLWIQCS